MRAKTRPWIVIAMLLGVVLLAADGPVILGGRTWSDPTYAGEIMPARVEVARAIGEGHLPMWWERAGLGAPMFAEPAHGAAYPPFWLAAASTERVAWISDLIAVLHALWAAVGVALLSRRLGADDLGALVAGALFAASDVVGGAIVGGGIGAVAHLAWAAWAADGVARAVTARVRIAHLAALAGAILAMLLAGRWLIAVDGAAIALVVGIARAPARRSAAMWCSGGIALGIVLAAYALVPALVHLGGAVASTTAARPGPSGWALLELIVPHARRLGGGGGPGVWLGATALLFAIAAVVGGGDSRRAIAIAAGVLALGGAGLLAPWDALVGVDRAAAHPAEHLAAASVLIAALAGVGFSRLVAGGADRRMLGVLAGGAAALVLVVAALATARPPLARALEDSAGGLDAAVAQVDGVLGQAALAAAIAIGAVALVIAASRRPWPAAVPAAGLLALAHAVVLGRLAHPQVPRPTFASAPALLEAAERATDPGAAARAELTAHGLSPRVYRPEHIPDVDDRDPAALAQTLGAAVPARFGVAAARWDAPGRRRAEDALWSSTATAGGRMFDRYAIDLAVLPRSIARPADLPVLGERGGWALVATRPSRPRAFLAASWRWFPDDDAAIAAIFPVAREPLVPVGAVARIGRGEDRASADPPRPCAVDAERPERVHVRCDGAGVVVLLDAWAPGWSVTVDDAPARLERVDAVARGVAVGAGAHDVVFAYAPPGAAVGAWLSLAALAGLIALVVATLLPSRR